MTNRMMDVGISLHTQKILINSLKMIMIMGKTDNDIFNILFMSNKGSRNKKRSTKDGFEIQLEPH